MKTNFFFFSLFSSILFFSCEKNLKQTPEHDPSTTTSDTNENIRISAFFKKSWDSILYRYPEFATFTGSRINYSKLDEVSEEFYQQEEKLIKNELDSLLNFNPSLLNPDNLLSYELFKLDHEKRLSNFKYRYHNYPISQFEGFHSDFPTFMSTFHPLTNKEDAIAYISRIRACYKKMKQLSGGLSKRAEMGIIPPKFVFPYVYEDCNNIIRGELHQNFFYTDFKSKIDSLPFFENEKKSLLNNLETALKDSLITGYQNLLSTLKELEKKSKTDDGVWKFPDGLNFYNSMLEDFTTTNLTPDQIFDLGISEVSQIHDEMKKIKQRVGFEGDLKAFFKFLRDDTQFYYDQNEEGKTSMLEEFQTIIDNMKSRLDEFFINIPPSTLEIKPVEEFKQTSASEAYYEQGTPDDSRPGIFRINLYKMSELPKYEMEALAYHEGIPGHHMQLSCSKRLQNLPEFRKNADYTAYIEGWGLYCENFPKEFGFYKDPYSDFGRLSMKLWRACRLVVDAGIHNKKWSRKKAIDYLIENTPSPEGICVKSVERYIVNPGQACAYYIGMMKIYELRQKAKNIQKEKFDIRQFHDLFLSLGPIPLSVFEQKVNYWLQP